ncbi:MAG: histidine kinase [Ferruginibacter sp.]|nr:histidine kinase [Ferruginibacter sp.]
MHSSQFSYLNGEWKNLPDSEKDRLSAGVVMVFADRIFLDNDKLIKDIQEKFPLSKIITCSSSGEIKQNNFQEFGAVCVSVQFEKTKIDIVAKNIYEHKNSFELGKSLAASLEQKDLKYILVISDGNLINGDDLISGIQEATDPSVLISGGLAGDADRFKKTVVGLDNNIKEGNVVLMGLYGSHIIVGTGTQGGWDVYGPERMVTKSEKNILYEIDGDNALDLYKKYLGKYADELPSSALLFPISVRKKEDKTFIVRTILSIDEKNKRMIFAGNITEGAEVRFMRANFDRLINAASDAGAQAVSLMNNTPVNLAILVSCVGRKIVLGDRIEEEIEAVAECMSPETTIAGFFSYGEIAPNKDENITKLHNQTMTVTTFAELI